MLQTLTIYKINYGINAAHLLLVTYNFQLVIFIAVRGMISRWNVYFYLLFHIHNVSLEWWLTLPITYFILRKNISVCHIFVYWDSKHKWSQIQVRFTQTAMVMIVIVFQNVSKKYCFYIISQPFKGRKEY